MCRLWKLLKCRAIEILVRWQERARLKYCMSFGRHWLSIYRGLKEYCFVLSIIPSQQFWEMFLPKFKHYRDIFMKIKSMLRNSCSLLFFLKAVTVEVLAYLICHLEVEMFHISVLVLHYRWEDSAGLPYFPLFQFLWVQVQKKFALFCNPYRYKKLNKKKCLIT